MFQLIVAVISIALVAALAGASIFYGGSAFSGSTAKANVASLINQGQQIAGAMVLYRTHNSGNSTDNIADLVSGKYLQATPTPPSITNGNWTIADDGSVAWIDLENDNANAVCDLVNEEAGFETPPASFDPNSPSVTDGAQYACRMNATDSYFVYNL